MAQQMTKVKTTINKDDSHNDHRNEDDSHNDHCNEDDSHNDHCNDNDSHNDHCNEADSHNDHCNDNDSHNDHCNEADSHNDHCNDDDSHNDHCNEDDSHNDHCNEDDSHNDHCNEDDSHNDHCNEDDSHNDHCNDNDSHNDHCNDDDSHNDHCNENSASHQGREFGNTFFLNSGIPAIETTPTIDPSSGASHGHGIRKDVKSVNSSSSGRVGTELSTIPVRSRTYLDPSGLMLMTSPVSVSVDGLPTYLPLAPTFIPYAGIMGEQSERLLVPKHRYSRHSPYVHLQATKMRHLVIVMASLFMIALVAVIFTAVYFGQGLDSRSRL
ncbi:hypothetical protein Btru_035266 [Bulinus truncatus]|nr:hypothetical protein Btru_035266 [Bulinus truncatus]